MAKSIFISGIEIEHIRNRWCGVVVVHVTANVKIKWHRRTVPIRTTKKNPPEYSDCKPSSLRCLPLK